MATQPLNTVRLQNPDELIAAVPHLLGFHPIDSLVLVTLRGPGPTRVGMTLRVDLPRPGEEAAAVRQLVQPAAQEHVRAAMVVVVGGPETTAPDPPTAHQLVAQLRAELSDAGVPILHAAWAATTAHRAPWRCYDDPDCHGELPDPRDTELAAASVAIGAVTFANRAEMAAQLALDDEDTLARRAALLDQTVDIPEQNDPIAAYLTLREAVEEVRAGRVPRSDEQIVRLAAALAHNPVRDAALAWADGADADPAERLWRALTTATPLPERAEPATLLAFCAYLRGDGALAAVALELAEQAMPGHKLAGLLRLGLDRGLDPSRLSVLANNAARTAGTLLNVAAAG